MLSHRLRPLLQPRTLPFHSTRANSTYQPPNPQPQQPKTPATNRHREFYRVFGRAWLKNFLVAVATYQVLYWGWKKLESIEVKHDTQEEIRALEGELRELTGRDNKGGR